MLNIEGIPKSLYDQIKFIISCNEIGVFDVEAQKFKIKLASARVQYSELVSLLFLRIFIFELTLFLAAGGAIQ